MADLVVIVPSRGRPEAARELVQVFNHTATTRPGLVFAVGMDDPTLPEYQALMGLTLGVDLDVCPVGVVDRPSTMNFALNEASTRVASSRTYPPPFAVGFMGDDHYPLTYGWDRLFLNELRALGTGIVYGDDLFQGERLPTQVAMTSDIVRALGYMAPPKLWHMYVDNFWLDLGRLTDCLRYLSGVVIEHRHPVAGKAALDGSYRRSNSAEVYRHDAIAYAQYHTARFRADVAKVRALRRPTSLATGGIVHPGQPVIVGEAGPELLQAR